MLIVLVALPVLGFAGYLWYQMEEYVRHRNRQDLPPKPKAKRRKR